MSTSDGGGNGWVSWTAAVLAAALLLVGAGCAFPIDPGDGGGTAASVPASPDGDDTESEPPTSSDGTSQTRVDADGDGLTQQLEEQYGLDDTVANREDFVRVLQQLHDTDSTAAQTLADAGTGQDATLTDTGQQFVDTLTDLDRDAYSSVVSALGSDGTLDHGDVQQVEFLADTAESQPEQFQELREQGALGDTDVDGDGIPNSQENTYRRSPFDPNPELGAVYQSLARDGNITENDDTYIQFLADSDYDRSASHSRWTQLEELGLLDDIPADGRVTDAERQQFANDDRDLLINAMEAELGTDPDAADTDGDGLRDDYEVYLTDHFPDAHPTEYDVYVEIDVMDQVDRLDRQEQQEMVEEAADHGVHLHLIYSDTVPRAETIHVPKQSGDLNDPWDYQDRFRDTADQGYHYALLAEDVKIGDTDFEGTTAGTLFFLSDMDGEYRSQESLFQHELGHAMGVMPEDFPWVDERDGSFDGSVMDYDAPPNYLGFADEEWKHIKNNGNIPSTDKIWFD